MMKAETKALRKQSKNALRIAKYLQKEDLIDQIFYPGLDSHLNDDAKLQQATHSNIISFTLKDDSLENALFILQNLKLFKTAENLKGLKSLATHPPSMNYKTIPEPTRKANGIYESLIQLSIGIEHVEDLVNDLAVVFAKLRESILSKVDILV